MSSQQQAGGRRSAAVDRLASNAEPKRNLTAILSDQAKIKTELAAKVKVDCGDGCFTLKVKVVALKSRLDVLEAEADEVKRWQAQQDRQEALKDSVRDDLVTTRMANWLGMTITQMGLITSLLFSFILEGLACLCRFVALPFRESLVIQPVMRPVTAVSELAREGSADDTQSLSELDSKVEELIGEVKAGRLKLTVNDVRDYCRCAQKKASELKRLVESELRRDSGNEV